MVSCFNFSQATLKEGLLNKMGHSILSSWTSRFFVLTETSLTYYEDSSKNNKKGEYLLNSSCVIEYDKTLHKHHPHGLRLQAHGVNHGGEELIIAGASAELIAEWKDAINNVIHKPVKAIAVSIVKPSPAVVVPAVLKSNEMAPLSNFWNNGARHSILITGLFPFFLKNPLFTCLFCFVHIRRRQRHWFFVCKKVSQSLYCTYFCNVINNSFKYY